MTKMLRLQMTWMSITALGSALRASIACIAAAEAADCPRKDALGTSRVLSVDAKTTPRVGLKSFPQTLPLADHEVVLTFDDGPYPPTTSKVLAALAQECVRATFFLIGKHASEHPDMVKRIAARGPHHRPPHLVAPVMARIPPTRRRARSTAASPPTRWRSMARDHDARDAVLPLPLFRKDASELDLLQSRGIVVFGADLWASDWNEMTPEQELKLVTERLAPPARASSCSTTPRRARPRSCRPSCDISGTTAIAWFTSCRPARHRRAPMPLMPNVTAVQNGVI